MFHNVPSTTFTLGFHAIVPLFIDDHFDHSTDSFDLNPTGKATALQQPDADPGALECHPAMGRVERDTGYVVVVAGPGARPRDGSDDGDVVGGPHPV